MIALLTGLLSHAVLAGSVLALAALGEVIAERSGVANLGVEGLVSLGAVVAVLAVHLVPDPGIGPWVGLLAACLVGAFGAGIFATATVVLRADQVLSGVATTFLGIGLSAVIGAHVAGMPVPAIFQNHPLPLLSRLPVVGPAFFGQNVLIYGIFLILPLLVHLWLFRTRAGLNLRAVGENPHAADAVGIPVLRLRVLAVVIGGAFAGAAGADLTLADVPVWSDGMVSGRGWIAVALVIFAGYRPVMAVLSGLLFGIVTALGFMGQARGWPIAPALLNTLPYLGTILCIIGPALLAPGLRRHMVAPAALGRIFVRGGR